MQINSNLLIFLIGLCLFSIVKAADLDICNESGFVVTERGLIRTHTSESTEFIYFITTKKILEGSESAITDDMVAKHSRDAAILGIFTLFKKRNPPDFKEPTLEYSGLQSFKKKCFGEDRYGYKIPIKSLSWSNEKANEKNIALDLMNQLIKEK